MNFTYENQGTTTFLVYAIENNDDIDSMSLGMITNNNIHGIAGTVITQIDEQKYIKFNVSSKVSVKQFFSGPVNKKRLLGVFSGITDAMLSAEDYMIDPNMFILDLDYIFADVSTCETVLICLPVANIENKSDVNLALFFKNIMFTTQFDQTENCDHVAKIMNYLNSVPTLSLVDFKKLLSSLSTENAGEPQKSDPRKSDSRPSTVTNPEKNSQSQKSGSVSRDVRDTGSAPIPKPAVTQKQPPNNPPARTIPSGVPVPPPVANTPKTTPQSTEKKISWFYLMQHYNRENAAAYKAQKEEKKKKRGTVQQPAPQSYTVPGAPQQYGNQPNLQQAPSNAGRPASGQPEYVAPNNTASGSGSSVRPTAQQEQISGNATSTIPYSSTVAQPSQNANQQNTSLNFGDTTVLNANGVIGETTVLSSTQQDTKLRPFLLRRKNNERIPVNKPVYRIGKEKSYVDYFVGDNTAVSRSHANIITRDGMYFIMDTNSTNHTYVNGTMIQSNVEVRLSSGDKFRLANEDFEFVLE